jgi:hypothetical protein
MNTLADAAATQRIVARLSSLRADALPRWGRMTAPEMICHLNDSFLTSFGEKEVSPAPSRVPRPVIKWFALHFPAQWPQNLPTRPEVQQGVGGTCPVDFAADRASLVQTIERFCVPDTALGSHPHPIFGLMSVTDWLRWGYLHTDHHLRQFGV